MKVLFVISTLRAGGAERVASTLAHKFSQGFDVTLLKFDNDEPFYELGDEVKLKEPGLSVSDKGIWGNLKKRFGKIFWIRKFIKDEKFDLVVSFMDSTNLLVTLANLGLKSRLIITEHSYHKFLSIKWQILKRIFYPLADALVVLTKEDLRHYDFVKSKVIYNPMFLKGFDTKLEKENLILFVGRLIKVKGCDIFLRSLNLIKDDLKDWKIAVLGDGEDKESLCKLALNLGLNVEFKGAVNNISDYYKKAKILTLSSRSEGLGNAFIEAIFYDVLRVATPTSGAKELINDGFDGLLSEDFEPQSLAKKIKIALGYDLSLVENARSKRDKFELETIFKEWENLIKEVVK